MNKQELIRRLTALLSALGVLSGGLAVAGELQEADDVVEEACADVKAKYPPYPTALYGITVDPWFKAGDLNKVDSALAEAQEALNWAQTEEGRQMLARDARMREIIENLKSNVPAIQRRLAETRKAQEAKPLEAR